MLSWQGKKGHSPRRGREMAPPALRAAHWMAEMVAVIPLWVCPRWADDRSGQGRRHRPAKKTGLVSHEFGTSPGLLYIGPTTTSRRPEPVFCLAASGDLPLQQDIVKVHLTRAAGRGTTLGAQANGYRVDVREGHTLERPQIGDPLVPAGILCHSRVGMVNN